jgi:hypothetical protein
MTTTATAGLPSGTALAGIGDRAALVNNGPGEGTGVDFQKGNVQVSIVLITPSGQLSSGETQTLEALAATAAGRIS